MTETKFVKAVSVGGYAEAEQVIELLKENGIAAYCQGGIMDVYTGSSINGEDVMISEKDLEKAAGILEGFHPIEVGPNRAALSKGQVVISRVLLGMIVLILMICVVVTVF